MSRTVADRLGVFGKKTPSMSASVNFTVEHSDQKRRGWPVRLDLCLLIFLVPSAGLAQSSYKLPIDEAWRFSKNDPGRPVKGDLSSSRFEPSSDQHTFEISGSHGRNNPVRRKLPVEYSGAEVFLRFLIRYDAKSIDQPDEDEGEFFVVWLDQTEGSDTATHSGAVPNVGIHVGSRNGRIRNLFMARFSSDGTAFSDVELKGDQTFLVVARLSKSRPRSDAAFDRLEMWIDPSINRPGEPDATARGGRLKCVRWIGVSTGLKTEKTDRVLVDGFAAGPTWESLFGLEAESVRPRLLASLRPEAPPGPEIKPTALQYEIGIRPEPSPTIRFRDDIYPLLKSRCFECHSGAKPRAKTRLDQLASFFGESAGLAIPGSANESRLIQRVSTRDSKKRMPPAGHGLPLTGTEIAKLRSWIDEGLAWDDELLPPATEPADHWAFQPVRRPAIPTSFDPKAFPVRSPIDAFIADQKTKAGLKPIDPADPRTLIRRASLVLLGLPPKPEEVEVFAAQWNSASATDATRSELMRNLTERLLDSPEYGVRWGRHWLDLARWAESNGYQHNRERPHAWRYRDYVVNSFNEDRAYDRFVTEQIAGDELSPYRDENVIATGFLAAARYSGNEKIKSLQRYDILVDIVNSTTASVLGLTFECCQCHDHKFDPISARDYHRFLAFFRKGQPVNVILDEAASKAGSDEKRRKRLVAERTNLFESTWAREYRALRKRQRKGELFILPKTVVARMTAEDRARYDAAGRELDQLPQTWAYYSPVSASGKLASPPLDLRWPLPFRKDLLASARAKLYPKGDVHSPGPVVQPGWPAVFGPVPNEIAESETPRSELARWLTSKDNPLTARVWVNRIWQWHFGQGLVETSSNFGTTVLEPDHIALLDWLAAELVENGWSTKHIHRLILSSSLFRQSSRFHKENAELDPDNRLLWRWEPRRLEWEAIRDSILATTAELTSQRGGPSVAESDPSASQRRSLYLRQRRKNMPHMTTLFDGADSLTSCSHRRTSTVPLQPLYLLNSQFMGERAKALAHRVRKETNDETTPEATVQTLFHIALSRAPQPDELDRSVEFLLRDDAPGQLEDLCLVILNLNEFLYVP